MWVFRMEHLSGGLELGDIVKNFTYRQLWSSTFNLSAQSKYEKRCKNSLCSLSLVIRVRFPVLLPVCLHRDQKVFNNHIWQPERPHRSSDQMETLWLNHKASSRSRAVFVSFWNYVKTCWSRRWWVCLIIKKMHLHFSVVKMLFLRLHSNVLGRYLCMTSERHINHINHLIVSALVTWSITELHCSSHSTWHLSDFNEWTGDN